MKNFNTAINNGEKEVNYKGGLTAYKFFKYWTLIMFLIIIPLTPILITIFGFHQIEQYELEFSSDATLHILSKISLGWVEQGWPADLFFKLFNNDVVALDFINGILSFNLSAFNVFLNSNGIDTSFITLDTIQNIVDSSDGKITMNIFYISDFSIESIWWVAGPCIVIATITISTSILWAFFLKFNEKNSWGEQKF